MPEEMFGPYRLLELIGRGGMGEVYRAVDTVRDRVVAVKRLPARLASDPEFEARFRAESALAARLNEPHIIPIHDFGEIDGRLFIDMRLVEGEDLAALLSRHGPLPAARAVNIVAQVAAALDAAHAEGLAHRDIKPANVLVTGALPDADGEFVYVADFGIARAVSSGATSLTATGTTVGSLDYMAPERFTGGHGDHRVDVYALGCLLFETLTARKPFVVEGMPAAINAHLHTPPPRPSEHVFGLPGALDAVVARAMAKDPEDRFPSAGALAAAARAATDGAAVPAATTSIGWPEHAVPLRRRCKRRGLAVLSAVAAVLAVIGGGMITLGFGERAAPSEFMREPVRTPGENPFMPPVGTDRPDVTPPPRSGGPFGGDTPGLYGGTMNNAACDPAAMSTFLQANPDKAAAWAQVQGIPPAQIPSYVARLTPVVLRSDTAVANHGYRNGRATPFPAVLQAGTAVLVDEYGVPRAKCYCGNPLAPPITPAEPRYIGSSWADFSPAKVTTVQQTTTSIAEFTLVDPTTDEVFHRPAGSRGDSDRPEPLQTSGPTPFMPGPTPQPVPPDPTTPQPLVTERRVVPPTDTPEAPPVPGRDTPPVQPTPAPQEPTPPPPAPPLVSHAPVITSVSSYREGVLVYLSIRYTDADGDAEGWGFRGANGSGWGEEDHLFSNPTYDRLSPGRVDYPFNHGCGQSNQIDSYVEAWVYDQEGRQSGSIVAHLTCSGTGVG